LNLNDIKLELTNWINNYLDIPSDYYQGLKPCPFAKRAWAENKVEIKLGDIEVVEDELKNWDDSYDLILIVYDPEEWDAEEYTEKRNDEIASKDLNMMAFAPTPDQLDDPVLEEEDWGVIINDYDYGLIFIQRLKNLNKASEILEKSGYYKNVSKKFSAYINKRRSLTCADQRKK